MLIMEVSLRFECNVMLNIYVMLLWPGITGIRTIYKPLSTQTTVLQYIWDIGVVIMYIVELCI